MNQTVKDAVNFIKDNTYIREESKPELIRWVKRNDPWRKSESPTSVRFLVQKRHKDGSWEKVRTFDTIDEVDEFCKEHDDYYFTVEYPADDEVIYVGRENVYKTDTIPYDNSIDLGWPKNPGLMKDDS